MEYIEINKALSHVCFIFFSNFYIILHYIHIVGCQYQKFKLGVHIQKTKPNKNNWDDSKTVNMITINHMAKNNLKFGKLFRCVVKMGLILSLCESDYLKNNLLRRHYYYYYFYECVIENERGGNWFLYNHFQTRALGKLFLCQVISLTCLHIARSTIS